MIIEPVDLSREDTQCGICFVDLDAAVGQIDDAGVLYVSMIIHSIPTATNFFSSFVAVLGLTPVLFLLHHGLVFQNHPLLFYILHTISRTDIDPCDDLFFSHKN